MRPRKSDRHLPACMYLRGKSYWYVKQGKWKSLGSDYVEALLEYARLTNTSRPSGMADLIDRALDYIAPKKARNTMLQYRAAGEKLKSMLAEFEPHQVLPKHVAAIKMHMADTPNMSNRTISVLRGVFDFALEQQLVDSNPCTGIRRHSEGKRDRYITDAEFQAIIGHCSEYMRQVFEMCFLTGQRIGDVLAIRRADVTPDGIAFKQQKTGARLVVAMSPDLERLIQRINALPRKVHAMTLFCSPRNGRPVSYETCKDAFAKARKAAGVVNLTIHDLRAKSLTDTKKQGNDPQILGGHADPKMTQRYVRAREIDIAVGPTMPKKSG